MKNKFIIPLIIAIIAIIGGGIYYYYYNYVETETHYYLIRYTPQREFNSPFGYNSIIDSKVEINGLKTYTSDSAAVADVKQQKENDLVWCEKELEKLTKQNPTDNKEQIQRNAQITALKEILEEQWAALSVTHTRNFDLNKVKEVMQVWNNPQKIEEFNNKYKISVRIYPI